MHIRHDRWEEGWCRDYARTKAYGCYTHMAHHTPTCPTAVPSPSPTRRKPHPPVTVTQAEGVDCPLEPKSFTASTTKDTASPGETGKAMEAMDALPGACDSVGQAPYAHRFKRKSWGHRGKRRRG